MTMNPWMVDCDIYNPMCLEKMEVSEEQWKAMQKAVHKRAIKQRKLYPEEHENGRPVGCTWTQGRWNAEKSAGIPAQAGHRGQQLSTIKNN